MTCFSADEQSAASCGCNVAYCFAPTAAPNEKTKKSEFQSLTHVSRKSECQHMHANKRQLYFMLFI